MAILATVFPGTTGKPPLEKEKVYPGREGVIKSTIQGSGEGFVAILWLHCRRTNQLKTESVGERG